MDFLLKVKVFLLCRNSGAFTVLLSVLFLLFRLFLITLLQANRIYYLHLILE